MFNTGWKALKNEWLSGPFKLENFNKTEKVLTEVPNDKWWGDEAPAGQDRLPGDLAGREAASFANNEIDSSTSVRMPTPTARQGVAGGAVRQAAGPNWRHITFNSTAGVLKDQKVRQAIVKGLDREAIGASDLAGIDWPVQPLNNNILLPNQEGYKDVAAETGIDYDAEGQRPIWTRWAGPPGRTASA